MRPKFRIYPCCRPYHNVPLSFYALPADSSNVPVAPERDYVVQVLLPFAPTRCRMAFESVRGVT